jgi:hypothetical protein
MTAVAQNVSMYQGDTKSLVFTVTDDAGAPKNITGALVRWVLQRWPTDTTPVLDKNVGAGITLTTPLSGILTVALAPADTLTLEGDYVHELEVTDTSTNVSTVAVGSMTILRSMA